MLPQQRTIPETSPSSSSSSVSTNRRVKRLQLREVVTDNKIAIIMRVIAADNSRQLMELIITKEDTRFIEIGKEYCILLIEWFRLQDKINFLEAQQKKREWDIGEWNRVVQNGMGSLADFLRRQGGFFYNGEWLQGNYSKIIEQELVIRSLFYDELHQDNNTKFIEENLLLGKYHKNHAYTSTVFALHPNKNLQLVDKDWLFRIFGISRSVLVEDLSSNLNKFAEARCYLALEIERAVDQDMFELTVKESEEYQEFCSYAGILEARNFFAAPAICLRYIEQYNKKDILALGHEALLLYLKFNQHRNGFYVWQRDSATADLRLIDRSYPAVIDSRKIPEHLTIGEYIETVVESGNTAEITYEEIFHVLLEDGHNRYVLLTDNGVYHKPENSPAIVCGKLLARSRQDIAENQKKTQQLPVVVTTNLYRIVPMLQHKYSVNAVINPSNGNTLLHEAIAARKIEVLKFLLENGADIFLTNKRKVDPLLLALRQEDNVCFAIIQPYLSLLPISCPYSEAVIAEKNLQAGLDLFKKVKPELDKHAKEVCNYRTILNGRWTVIEIGFGCARWVGSWFMYTGQYDSVGLYEYYRSLHSCHEKFTPIEFKGQISELCQKRELISGDPLHGRIQEIANSILVCEVDFIARLEELRKADEESTQQQLPDKDRQILALAAELEQKTQNLKPASYDEHKLELQALLQQQEERLRQEQEKNQQDQQRLVLELKNLEQRRIQDLQEAECKRLELEQKMKGDLQESERKRLESEQKMQRELQESERKRLESEQKMKGDLQESERKRLESEQKMQRELQESERKRQESEQKMRAEFLELVKSLASGNHTAPQVAPVIAPTLVPLANMAAVSPAATSTAHTPPTLAPTSGDKQPTAFFAHK